MFFATIGPFDVAAIYAALTASAPPRQRRIMAVKGTAIATLLLLSFVLAGEAILEWLGIYSGRDAGGRRHSSLVAGDRHGVRPSGGEF